MKLSLEQIYDLKVFWFSRWLAMCYADTYVEEMDGELVPSSGKDAMSVLNMEDGMWYATQYAHFENQVFPIWLKSAEDRNELSKTLGLIKLAFSNYKEEEENKERDSEYLMKKINKKEQEEMEHRMWKPINEFVEENSFLSNFWSVPVDVFGHTFPTSEHAYMSQKNIQDLEWLEKCKDPKITAAKIKNLSREIQLREDWDSVKIDVMYQVLEAKFQNLEMKEKLLNTGKAFLMEGNTWNDLFWGVDLKTRKGKNMLGKLLMQIRENLQEK